jgi:hypothetical protein
MRCTGALTTVSYTDPEENLEGSYSALRNFKFAVCCTRTIRTDERERSVQEVILRIPRKAISHRAQQLAICIGRHKSLRQNNDGSRSPNQLCRPFEENSGTLKETGLPAGAHCYVNGIVNKQKRRTSLTQNQTSTRWFASSRKLHSLACFVCCWYRASSVQGREWRIWIYR